MISLIVSTTIAQLFKNCFNAVFKLQIRPKNNSEIVKLILYFKFLPSISLWVIPAISFVRICFSFIVSYFYSFSLISSKISHCRCFLLSGFYWLKEPKRRVFLLDEFFCKCFFPDNVLKLFYSDYDVKINSFLIYPIFSCEAFFC